LLESEDGRNIVIRPMAYCWESDIEAFAEMKKFPVIPCGVCGAQKNLKRKRMRQLIENLQQEIPEIRHSLLAAVGKLDASVYEEASVES
jgi:tRNA 2-thiocytidine biosynthesis protein TtcA